LNQFNNTPKTCALHPSVKYKFLYITNIKHICQQSVMFIKKNMNWKIKLLRGKIKKTLAQKAQNRNAVVFTSNDK